MHEAYGISHLLTQIDQIEALAAFDGHLLLGTRMGYLRKYTLALNSETQKYEVQMEYYCKTFSKKPIQQIEVIPGENLFLCLTDNILGVYDLRGPNFSLKTTFQKTKGASMFCSDYESAVSLSGKAVPVIRLCVAVKKKLQLYFGKNGEFKEHTVQFAVPDIPKAIAWGRKYLCVGFKSEYQLFDLSTSNPKELFPTSSSRAGEPTVTKLSETSFLLGRGDSTVLVEETSELDAKEVNIRCNIKWEESPTAVVWDEPYVLGLVQNKVVVKTVEPNLFIQTLSELNNARLMYKCKRGLILVASVGQVWILNAVNANKQREQLLKDKQYKLAIDLTNLSDLPEDEKRQETLTIQKQYARDLFEKREYSESINEYLKLNTNPAEVIKLYSDLESKLGPEDMTSAMNALVKYLTTLRDACSSNGDLQANPSSQLELIDTTLLKCYLQTNDALVARLVRCNNCRLEEAERLLQQHNKSAELVILYQMKGLHARALQTLRDHAQRPDSSLKGCQPTINYLKDLGPEHLNLIFKYSGWILEKHPEEGLKIFTEDIANVEKLPRASVLDFLLREHEPLVIPYLEHVLHVWNDTTPSFHDALITKYREKITDKAASRTEEEVEHVKAKLMSFLEESSQYTPERVLLHFPGDSLFQERAIVLGKLGRYEQALAIHVQILGDVDKAISYCERMSDKCPEKAPDLYLTLLRILVSPQQASLLTGPLATVPRHPATAEPDLETTLAVLEKHIDKIPPLKALAILPDSIPLVRLRRILQSALDSQLTLKRRTQALKGLLYAENIQVQEQKRFHESKSVVINDYNVCPVCKKRFGNQSAFVRYPNGDFVHYSCKL